MEAVVNASTVSDVVCTDEVLTEEIDEYEEARNKIVEKVLVYPVSNPNVQKKVIENEIEAKFNAIGVTVKHMNTKTSLFGNFNGSIVNISPVNLNTIWGRRLGLKSCSIIHYPG